MGIKDEELANDLRILKALDDAVENGPWDKSLFFMTIGKKLKDIRDNFFSELNEGEDADAVVARSFKELAIEQGLIGVYVSLYLAEGNNITKWQTLLSTITVYSVSRPVYKSELDIKAAIRAKDDKIHDAYIEAWVSPSDIMLPPANKAPVDRYGHELLILKENSIQPKSITEFVHLSGIYQYANGVLVRQGDSGFR